MRARALIIGMFGPAIQAAGVLWVGAHLALSHRESPLTPRHIMFEPAFLLVFVGFLVSVVCVPIALEVARSNPEDVALPIYGPVEAEAERAPEARV